MESKQMTELPYRDQQSIVDQPFADPSVKSPTTSNQLYATPLKNVQVQNTMYNKKGNRHQPY
ncbi:hypothetical protein ACF0H5_009083 [Mactra antiquata]